MPLTLKQALHKEVPQRVVDPYPNLRADLYRATG
jgi:hypothetical protein